MSANEGHPTPITALPSATPPGAPRCDCGDTPTHLPSCYWYDPPRSAPGEGEPDMATLLDFLASWYPVRAAEISAAFASPPAGREPTLRQAIYDAIVTHIERPLAAKPLLLTRAAASALSLDIAEALAASPLGEPETAPELDVGLLVAALARVDGDHTALGNWSRATGEDVESALCELVKTLATRRAATPETP